MPHADSRRFRFFSLAGGGLLLALAGGLPMGCDSADPPPADPTPVAAAPAPEPTTPTADASKLTPSVPVASQLGNAAPSTDETPVGPLPVRVEPPTMNIGFVAPGQETKGQVVVYNTGDKPLTIVKSSASCTCTAVNLTDAIIMPGESIVVPAEFEAGMRLGPKTATIKLIFAGYDDEVLEIPISAEIALSVRAEPNPIRYQLSPDTNQEKAAYVVSSIDKRPFSILAVQGAEPPFLDFDPEKDEPRNSYRLLWDFTRYNLSTCLDEEGVAMPTYLVIETDHPDAPVIDVQVRHRCTLVTLPSPGQGWVLSDPRALLGALAPGETKEIEVSMRWMPNSTPDETIVSVVSDSTQFTAELGGRRFEGDKTWYTIKVTPTEGHRGLLYGKVRILSERFDASMLMIGKVVEGDQGGS